MGSNQSDSTAPIEQRIRRRCSLDILFMVDGHEEPDPTSGGKFGVMSEPIRWHGPVEPKVRKAETGQGSSSSRRTNPWLTKRRQSYAF